MNRFAPMLLGATLTCAVALATDGSEPATLPYRTLCEMAQLRILDPAMVTNRQVTLSVSSTNPLVSPADIALFIDARAGRIPLAVSATGRLTVPITEALLRENPNVVANQPKGSMILQVAAAEKVKLSETGMDEKKGLIRYSVLFASEVAKRRLAAQLTEELGPGHAPDAATGSSVVAIKARTSIASAEVSLLTGAGEVPLKPVEPGHFVLRFDPKLFAEDPWVRLKPGHDWSITTRVHLGENTAD